MKQISSYTKGSPLKDAKSLQQSIVVDKNKQQIKKQQKIQLPFFVQDQLQLNVQKYSQQIKQQIRYLLIDLLKYPVSVVAQRHKNANKIGYYDLHKVKNKKVGHVELTGAHNVKQYCEDCGYIIQERQVPLCSSVWQVPGVGLATYNFFQNIRLLMIQMVILGLIYSIICLKYNLDDSTISLESNTLPLKVSGATVISLYSINDLFGFLIKLQSWLLVGVVFVWWILKFIYRCLSMKYQRIVDAEHLSDSEFTMMIQDIPLAFSKQLLQKQFDRYFEQVKQKIKQNVYVGSELQPFTINKITRVVPFPLLEDQVLDRQLDGLDRDIYQKKKLFANWINQMKVNAKFSYSKQLRLKQYIQFQNMIERRRKKLLKMQQKVSLNYRKVLQNKSMGLTNIFVTFNTNQSPQIIDYLNPQGLPAKIRYVLSFFSSTDYFAIKPKNNTEFNVSISRAPQPEDIIWGNIVVPTSVKLLRQVLAFQLPLAFAGACIGIMFAISQWQKKSGKHESAIVVGAIVGLFSYFIKVSARLVSRVQKTFTQTDKQRSILFKGIFALCINWTLPSILTNILGQNQNYINENGLIYQIFYIGLFSYFLPPLLRLVDPAHFIYQIYICWIDRPYKKLPLKQSQLNHIYEGEQYQLGWCYLYFIDVYYFTCFYITVHPGAIIPALIGIIIMFWAQKYALFYRSQRPMKRSKALTQTVQTLLLLGPLLLWLGHFIWIVRITQNYSFQSGIFIANISLLGVSVIYFLTPYNSIFECLCHLPNSQLLHYKDCKQKLKKTYQSQNPATIQKLVIAPPPKPNQNSLIFYQFNQIDKKQPKIQDTILAISKIPAVFGKKNYLSRKISQSDLKQLKNSKKQQLKDIYQNPYLGLQSNQKQLNIQDELNITQQNLNPLTHDDSNTKIVKNINSDGHIFERRKYLQNKKRTVNILDGLRNYEFDIQQKH